MPHGWVTYFSVSYYYLLLFLGWISHTYFPRISLSLSLILLPIEFIIDSWMTSALEDKIPCLLHSEYLCQNDQSLESSKAGKIWLSYMGLFHFIPVYSSPSFSSAKQDNQKTLVNTVRNQGVSLPSLHLSFIIQKPLPFMRKILELPRNTFSFSYGDLLMFSLQKSWLLSFIWKIVTEESRHWTYMYREDMLLL